jgi:hypothetical protein
MRASGFNDGAAYAEVQLGRVLVERGAAAAADELLGRAGAELLGCGRKSGALEAALVQALARVRLGQPGSALELIDRTAATPGVQSGLLAPQVAESRAAALAALGRPDEAEAELASGLETARERGLSYEEGRLLRARNAMRRAAGREPDPTDVRASSEILGALGVRPAPDAPQDQS